MCCANFCIPLSNCTNYSRSTSRFGKKLFSSCTEWSSVFQVDAAVVAEHIVSYFLFAKRRIRSVSSYFVERLDHKRRRTKHRCHFPASKPAASQAKGRTAVNTIIFPFVLFPAVLQIKTEAVFDNLFLNIVSITLGIVKVSFSKWPRPRFMLSFFYFSLEEIFVRGFCRGSLQCRPSRAVAGLQGVFF